MPSVAGNTRFSVGDNFTTTNANAYPRGCFSYFENKTGINLTTSAVLMSVINWTAESTRIYKITYFEPQILLPSSGNVDMTIRVTSAAGTQVALTRAAGGPTPTEMLCSVVLTGLSGAVTYAGCLLASSTAGTPSATRSATQSSLMLVEDIGGT